MAKILDRTPVPLSPHTPSLGRARLLDTLNSVLGDYGAEKWTDNSLGDHRKGEAEIVCLEDVVEIEPRRVRLMLRIMTPDKTQYVVPLHVGGTLVYVIPYLSVAGDEDGGQWYIFLTKRWRIEHRTFVYELPHMIVYDGLIGRGAEGRTDPFGTAAFAVMQKFYGNDFATAIGASSVHLIARLTMKGEATRAEVQLYSAMLRFPFKRKRGEGEIVRLTWKQTVNLMDKGDLISDANTVAALYKATSWFRKE